MKYPLLLLCLLACGALIWYLVSSPKETPEETATRVQQDARQQATALETVTNTALEETTTPPIIEVHTQPRGETSVTIARVETTLPLWIVAYTDDTGKPGRMVGQVHVDTGVHTDIFFDISPPLVTNKLYLVAHKDAGTPGVFEFPGADVALAVDGVVVVTPLAFE